MEENNQAKNRHSIFLDVLFTLLGVTIVFFILQISFDFSALEYHKHVAFGLSFFTVSALSFLSIAELVSLSFDKTAVKSTLAFTLFLLAYYLLSYEFMSAVSFMGNDVTDTANRICYSIGDLSLFGAMFFIIYFFKHQYGIGELEKVALISIGSLSLSSGLFMLLSLDVVALILSSAESLLLAFLSLFYFLKMKGDNPLPGRITAIIVLCLSFSLLFETLSVSSLFTLNLGGLLSLLFFVVIMGYAFIYAHFLISKTKGYYVYEENEHKRKMEAPHIKMKVTCFHTFDCYLGDAHLEFPSKKSKEFFALLVILRGKALSMDKAITYLWPEKDIDLAKRSYRDVIYKLRKFFGDNSFYGVTFKRAETILNPNSLECDYYAIIERKCPYDGSPLMPEYDWSLDFENNLNK